MNPLPRAVRRGLRSHGAVGLFFTLAGLVFASPAPAATRPLHLTVRNLAFTSFSCPDPAKPLLCQVTATGDVNSNLSTAPGTAEYDLAIDFSPGFDTPCNVVDETTVVTFAEGTLTIRSHHRDCPANVRPGPRVDTNFTITGATGAFAAASGGGTEHSSHAEQASVIYNGRVQF